MRIVWWPLISAFRPDRILDFDWDDPADILTIGSVHSFRVNLSGIAVHEKSKVVADKGIVDGPEAVRAKKLSPKWRC